MPTIMSTSRMRQAVKPAKQDMSAASSENSRAAQIKLAIKRARETGTLRLVQTELSEWPNELLSADCFYHPDQGVDGGSSTWWQVVDLERVLVMDNRLAEVPLAMVEAHPTVVAFDAQRNCIESLPSSIARGWPALSLLNMASNRLTTLPRELLCMTSLTVLTLSDNQLSGDGLELGGLSELQVLDMSGNRLEMLPGGIHRCTRLRRLNLSNNRIRGCVPSAWSSLRQLEDIDLSRNELEGMDGGTLTLQTAQRVDLKQNNIRALTTHSAKGSSILVLPVCRELLLGNNCLVALPDNVDSAWPQLNVLDVRDNKLADLPSSIAQLAALQRLDLTNNDLGEVPAELGRLALHSLLISGNRIRGAPRAEAGTPALLKWLQGKISIVTDADEKDMLNSIGSMRVDDHVTLASTTGATSVSMSRRQLIAFPALASNIVDVDLSHNAITRFDDVAGPQTSLRHLNMTCNRVASLPVAPTLAHLFPALDTLDLTANRLSGTLDFTQLPTTLTVLLLADNKLTTMKFSDTAKPYPPMLKTLDVSNNELARLPVEIARWDAVMSVLKVGGNPFKVPRQAVVNGVTVSVLKWLKMQMTNG